VIYTYICGLNNGFLDHRGLRDTLRMAGMRVLSERAIPGVQNVSSKFQSSECVARMRGTHRTRCSTCSPVTSKRSALQSCDHSVAVLYHRTSGHFLHETSASPEFRCYCNSSPTPFLPNIGITNDDDDDDDDDIVPQ
jgi:hypothetical protein